MKPPLAMLLATGAAAAGLALTGQATAAPVCTPATPTAGSTVTCTYSGGGSTTLTVPPGTSTLGVNLAGGGGAGGEYIMMGSVTGGSGGQGARVEAFIDATGLSAITVLLGSGGANGGAGGGFSALYAGSAVDSATVQVVAGGGGGGGRANPGPLTGGSGAAAGSAAGGSAPDNSAAFGRPGGLGGAGGIGAAAVAGVCAGGALPGSNWSAGGAGAAPYGSGGAGGSGYGGGGGGCGSGGGAGGSYAATAPDDPATFSPTGGAGGAGGTSGTPAAGAGGAGGNGTVQITFVVASYALTYVGNGATGGSVPADSGTNWIYDTVVTLDGNTGGLARPGYSFAGWNTQADGSGTAYAPGATVTMRAALTLYAQWSPIPAASTTAPGTGAAPAPTGPARPSALAGRFSLKKGVGTTTGTVPAGATSIIQTARTGGSSATESFLDMAKAKTATGKCRITTMRNKKTKKVTKRTYTCTIRLAKETWAITTTARGTAGVVAEGTRRVVVK